jgi:hypothetical protein
MIKYFCVFLFICPSIVLASHGILPYPGFIYDVSVGDDTTPPTVTTATIDNDEGSPVTITYDTATDHADDASAGSTITISVTVGSNNNRVLVVGVGAEETDNTIDGNLVVNSVTYDGEALTEIDWVEYKTDEDWVGLYYILAPSTGANNVVVTFNESCRATVGAISLYNVAQQAPEADNSGTGTGSTPSLSLTTITDNAWVTDVISVNSSSVSIAENAGQTERYDGKNYQRLAGSTKPVVSAGATTTGSTLTGYVSGWGMISAAFTPFINSSTSTLTLNFNENVSQSTNWANAEILVDCSVTGNDLGSTYQSGDGTPQHVFEIDSGITAEDVCYLNFDENSTGDVLVDDSDNDLAAITGTDKLITNLFAGAPDTVAPSITSAVITGDALMVYFDETVVEGAETIVGEFLVDMSTTGNGIACTYVSGWGTQALLFSTASPSVHGETVYLRFDIDSSGDIVEDAAENDLAPITGTSQIVINATAEGDEYERVFYVTESGAGSMTGSSLNNAMSASMFNALGSAGFEDYENMVFYFSGTLTTTLVVDINGTSDGHVTFDGDETGDCDPKNSYCSSAATLTQIDLSNGDDWIIIRDFNFVPVTGYQTSSGTGVGVIRSTYSEGVENQGIEIRNCAFGHTGNGGASVYLQNRLSDFVIDNNYWYNTFDAVARPNLTIDSAYKGRITNNKTYGGMGAVWYTPKRGTFEKVVHAYNYIESPYEEGYSFDLAPDGTATTGYREYATVSGSTSTTVTLSGTGYPDYTDGQYYMYFATGDLKGRIAKITGQDDDEFTLDTTNGDFDFSDVSNGDGAFIYLIYRHNYVAYNTSKDVRYGNASILFYGNSFENWIEYNTVISSDDATRIELRTIEGVEAHDDSATGVCGTVVAGANLIKNNSMSTTCSWGDSCKASGVSAFVYDINLCGTSPVVDAYYNTVIDNTIDSSSGNSYETLKMTDQYYYASRNEDSSSNPTTIVNTGDYENSATWKVYWPYITDIPTINGTSLTFTASETLSFANYETGDMWLENADGDKIYLAYTSGTTSITMTAASAVSNGETWYLWFIADDDTIEDSDGVDMPTFGYKTVTNNTP